LTLFELIELSEYECISYGELDALQIECIIQYIFQHEVNSGSQIKKKIWNLIIFINLCMYFYSAINMSFSRRPPRAENTVIVSTAMTQNVEPYGIPLPAMVKVALTSQAVGEFDLLVLQSIAILSVN